MKRPSYEEFQRFLGVHNIEEGAELPFEQHSTICDVFGQIHVRRMWMSR